jgi:outer membrane protein assembly factor BamB
MCHEMPDRRVARGEASREQRYYKRVSPRRTTRCCGAALGASVIIAANGAPAVGAQAPFPTAAPPDKPAAPPAAAAQPNVPAYTTAWSLPLAADGSLTLALTNDMLFVAGPDTVTEARALADGQVIWTVSEHLTGPVVAGGCLIGIAGSRLIAVNLADGASVWSLPLSGPTAGLTAADDTIFFSDGFIVRAHRAADGAALWQHQVDAAAIVPPAADASMLVTALDDRTLAAFERASGRPLWRSTVEVTAIGLHVSGDRVYLAAREGFACAHKREHGRKDWCFNVRVAPIGRPVTDERYVYFAFLDNMVHVFDRENGRRFFTPSLDALPAGGPTLTADALIVPVVTGEFVLLNPGDGFSDTRVSSPRAAELPSTRATAVSADGTALALVIGSPSGRSIMLFRRAAADAAPKSGGTESGTPPAPPGPAGETAAPGSSTPPPAPAPSPG